MVAAVRRGQSLRAVALAFRVALRTVQRWVERAKGKRLDRVDWSSQSRRPHGSPMRIGDEMQARILRLRRTLKDKSALGEFGAAAIRRALLEEACPNLPGERTIHRILERRGALDGNRRVRRVAPPPGWYLSDVASQSAELDQVDLVEGLVIRGGTHVEVLNLVSLHGGLIACWPAAPYKAARVRARLLEHWRGCGLPDYVQFDNGTVFLGPSNHPDVIGSVCRMCLSLGVIPVFAPPRETGFQAAIESLNGRWQAKVWARFEHDSMERLVAYSDRYVAASRKRAVVRIEGAADRRPFPGEDKWRLTKELLQAAPQGRLVVLRRTNDNGVATVLGRDYVVDVNWPHRLVRAEVDLTQGRLSFYALRRRAPEQQPLLLEVAYALPKRKFQIEDFEEEG